MIRLLRLLNTLPSFAKLWLTFLFCIPLSASAQLSITWQQVWGGSLDDLLYDVIRTQEGGYLFVGASRSDDGNLPFNLGGLDAWMVKTDSLGQLQWQRHLGGSNEDAFRAVIQTSDNGYAAVGYSASNDGDVSGQHGGTDCWVVRFDVNGALIWQRALGGSAGEQAFDILQTSDGGFLVVGYSYSTNGEVSNNNGLADVWVIKLNFLGNIVWQKNYGGTEDDWATSLAQSNDGDFLVAGWTASSNGDVSQNQGASDFWLLRLDSNGVIEWEHTYGGSAADKASAILALQDGNFALAGYSYSSDGAVSGAHGGADVWVMKVDQTGSTVWTRAYGGSWDDRANGLVETENSGLVVAGRTFSYDGDVARKEGGIDYWLMGLNPEGLLQWEHAFGGNEDDLAHSIVSNGQAGYVVVGQSRSEDADVAQNQGGQDAWAIEINPWTTNVEPDAQSLWQIAPNPVSAQGVLQVSGSRTLATRLRLRDLQGRLLRQWEVPAGAAIYPIALGELTLSPGLYLLEGGQGLKHQSLRLVVE